MQEQEEPQTDDLKTLFNLKIPRKVFRLMDSDLAKMFFILLLLGAGFFMLGAIQYLLICKPQNEDVTVMQCISHTEKRHK